MLQILPWPQGPEILEKKSDQQTPRSWSKFLVLPPVLYHHIDSLTWQWAHNFSWLPFAEEVLTGKFLISLQVPGQTQIQMGFGLLNPILACSNRVSLLFPGCLPFFHLLYTFFSHMSFFRSNLSIAAGLLLSLSDFSHQDRWFLENQPSLLDPSSLQGCNPWDSSRQVPKQTQVCTS